MDWASQDAPILAGEDGGGKDTTRIQVNNSASNRVRREYVLSYPGTRERLDLNVLGGVGGICTYINE